MKTQMALILLGFGLTGGLGYAAHIDETPMPASNDVTVTAPDQTGVWSVGATAVLLQPTNKPFIYAYNVKSTVTSDTYDPVALNEGYSWWFGADVAYAFPGNGRDVTLAYEGLHGTTTDNSSENFNNAANTNVHYRLVNNVTGNYVNSIQAEANTQYDAGDLVFGQKLNAGTRIQLHPFLGLRYAHIAINDSFADTLDPHSISQLISGNESGELDSTFNGIGPRLGSDATVNLARGFSIRGRLGLSALIGTQTYQASYVTTQLSTNPSRSYTDNVTLNDNSKTGVVPEVDARLGLNYIHDFENNKALGFEVGWQITNYFGVIDNPYTDSGNGVKTPARENYGDFGLQGPYARIQIDID